MKKKETIEVKYMKLNTALVIAFAALVAGFLIGNIYSVYKGQSIDGGTAFKRVANPSSGSAAPAVDTSRIQATEKAVLDNPENTTAWLDLGNLYFDSDQFEKAIGAYSEYVKRFPNNPNAWTDLGVMYRSIGQPVQALEAFNKAIQVDPRHQPSRFNKGIVFLHDMKDPGAAIEAWKELEKLNPNFTAPSGQSLKDLIQNASK